MPITRAIPEPINPALPGNIDLSQRQPVINPDGSVSTVRSIGVNIDGLEYLLPTVAAGRILSDEDAIRLFRQSGRHLGAYLTQEDADLAAQQIHDAEARRVGGLRSAILKNPAAPAAGLTNAVASAPAFDPSKPYTVVRGGGTARPRQAPAFDPSKPYTVVKGEDAAAAPAFDPNKPYTVVRGEGRDTSRDSYEAQLEDLGITPQEQKEVEEIGRSAERYSDLWAAKEEAARKGEYWEGFANRAGQLSDWLFEPLTRPISGVIGRPVDALINLAYPGGGGGAPGDPGYVEQITGRSVIPPIPRAENLTEEETQALGWSPLRSGATKVAGGVWNAAAGLLQGLSTPDMIAQLPAAGNKAVLSGWISSMAAHAPERVMAAAEKYRAGDTQGAVEEVASAVGELGLAELGRRHVMRGPGDISVADIDGPPRLQINERGEVVDRASPDLIARNVAAPGTMRPQEIQTWGLPDIEAPSEMVRVPQVNQYGEPVPIYERVPIYNEYGEVVDVRMRARPRPPRRMAAPPIREMVMEEPSRIIQPELPRNVRESPEGGKVSFAAGAPVLNREAISYPKPPPARSLFSEAEVEQVVRGSGFEPSEVRRLSRLSMEELEREWMAARDAHERALAEGKTLGELAGTGLDWRVGILQNLMERAFRLGERAPRPAPPEPEAARRLPPIREVVMEEPSRIIQPELPRNVRESPEGGKVSFAAEAPVLNREAVSFEEPPPEPPPEPPAEPPGGGVPGGGGPRPPPAPGGLSIDLALAQEAARREGQRARRVAAPLIRDLALEEPPIGLTPPGNLPESQSTAPETITGPPAGRGEKEGKASVMPAEAGESPAPVRSIPEGGRPGRRRGTNRPPDIIDHILNTIGKIKTVSASHKRDASLYEGWQDLRRFGAAREVLSPGGIAPDVALRSLIEDRYMPEGATIDDLRNAIIDAAKARRGDREATSEENRLIRVMERQHLDFVKSGINRRLPGIAVTDLFAGDKFKLNGVEVRVQDFEFDENGEVIAVILDDGRRYGTQRVGAEQIIRPDKGTLERTQAGGFEPEPPKPTEEVKKDAVQELGPGGVSEEPGAIGVSPVGEEVRPAEEGAKAPETGRPEEVTPRRRPIFWEEGGRPPKGWEESGGPAEGSPPYGMADKDIADRLAARGLRGAVRIVSGQGSRWAMRAMPDGTIEINRDGARAHTFEHDLDHELAHLADRDPVVRATAEQFDQALTAEERSAVDEWLGRGYDPTNLASEARAEALNQLRQRAQAWNAWQRFTRAIAAWWRRMTGQTPSSNDVARLANALIKRAERDVRTRQPAPAPGGEVQYAHPSRVHPAVHAAEGGKSGNSSLGRVRREKREILGNIVGNYNLVTPKRGESPHSVLDRFIHAMEENLLWLHDEMPGAGTRQERASRRERAANWYPGANALAHREAVQRGHPLEATAGVISTQSPGTGWYRNVALAERIVDIWDKKDARVTRGMRQRAREIVAAAENPKGMDARFREFFRRAGDRPFWDMSLQDKATFVRLYDEAHNSPSYRILTPEGKHGPLVTIEGGRKLGTLGWQSFPNIQKALAILENPSAEVINEKLGFEHKVRNFFNNILDPRDPRSLTVDTQAVAAGLLKPVGIGSPESRQNFGSPSDVKTGVSGTYPVYDAAYREAARQTRRLPSTLQSIVWEGVRGLFTPELKRDKAKVAKVDEIWQRFRDGRITAKEARKRIVDVAGELEPPDWERGTGGDRPPAPARYPIDAGELHVGRRHGRTAGRRAGEATAAPIPEERVARAKPEGEAKPEAKPGVISETDAEAWADQTIQRSKSLGVRPVDPLELFAAYVVKGAAIMERGTRRFADWSLKMIAEYGDGIRPHLRRIYEQASAGLARAAGDNRELKQRKLAERGARSPQVAAPHRERLRTGAEAFYEPQDTGRAEDLVSKMTSEELSAVPVMSPDGPANLWTMAQLELYRRNVARGNMDAAWHVLENAMRTGTSLGQLINQFKMLRGATPHAVQVAINMRLKNAGYDPMRPSEQLRTRRMAEVSIKANAKWKEAERAAIAAPTDANVDLAMAARKEAVAADVQLQRIIHAYQPRVFWDMLTTLLKGNLLAPISQTANIAGNTSNLAIRASDRSQRAVVDSIDSYVRNRPREAAVAPVRGTIEGVKAIGRAVPDAIRSLWQGTSDAELSKADVQRGLQPLVALRNLFTRDVLGPQRNGKTPLGQRLLMALEASPFSMHATAQLRLLGAVDKLYKNPARARLIVEALKLRDANRPKGTPKLYTPENAAQAAKYPELFFDEATLERIDHEAATAVYQQKNPISKAMNRAMANAKPGARFAVATFAPYVTTPTNVIGEWMSYNPLIAMTNAIRHGVKGNKRAAETAAGKMVSGLMMLGAGAWLYDKGLISPSLEQPSEQQKARILEGQTMRPHHINLSGLKRALAGGDPKWREGDETRDILRAGGAAGALMLSATDVLRQRERQPKAGGLDLAARVLGDQWTQMLQYGVNQSFAKGTANLLDAIQEGKVDSWMAQYADTLSAIPLPGTLAAAARATRENKPEVRGDSITQRLENQLRSRLGVFGTDDKLPYKRDLWGRPIKETPEGNLPWVYHMLDVSKASKIPNDPVALLIYGLWRRTGKESIIPTPPDANFTIAGREFDPLDREQLSRLQELVGQARYGMAQRILLNERFINQPLEAKLATLEKVWNAGARQGGAQFWRERGSQLKPKRGRAGFIQE